MLYLSYTFFTIFINSFSSKHLNFRNPLSYNMICLTRRVYCGVVTSLVNEPGEWTVSCYYQTLAVARQVTTIPAKNKAVNHHYYSHYPAGPLIN